MRSIRDRAALKELVEEYQQSLGSYLLHLLGDLDLALAVTIETFVGAHRANAASWPRASVRSWLYRRATAHAYRHLRQVWQPKHAISLLHAGQADERTLVQAALRDLHPDQRAVLLLCELQRLPRDEVAAILGVGIDGVDQKLATAQARFRRAYLAHDSLT